MLSAQTVIHVLFVSHFRFLSPAVVLSVFLWRHMKNLFEAAGEEKPKYSEISAME